MYSTRSPRKSAAIATAVSADIQPQQFPQMSAAVRGRGRESCRWCRRAWPWVLPWVFPWSYPWMSGPRTLPWTSPRVFPWTGVSVSASVGVAVGASVNVSVGHRGLPWYAVGAAVKIAMEIVVDPAMEITVALPWLCHGPPRCSATCHGSP